MYSGKYSHILTEVTKPQREILQHLNITVSSQKRLGKTKNLPAMPVIFVQ